LAAPEGGEVHPCKEGKIEKNKVMKSDYASLKLANERSIMKPGE
jgi:hypothetical protein